MTRRELHAKIAELRATLGLRRHRTIGEWEAMPQEVRDGLAARAWISEWGDPTSAFLRLGFAPLNRLPPNKVQLYRDYVVRIFGTPGVQAILARDLAIVADERRSILARQVKIALYGDDAESVRAAALLIRVCGWAAA